MATEIWVNIGSGNGLLPDGTKPLPEPMLTYHHLRSSGIHLRAILQEIPQPSVTEMSLKITYLKFCSNLPGANELNWKRKPQSPITWSSDNAILVRSMSFLSSTRGRRLPSCLVPGEIPIKLRWLGWAVPGRDTRSGSWPVNKGHWAY